MRKIIITNILQVLFFTVWFILTKNSEFLLYVGIILAVGLILVFTHKKVKYPKYLLWLLTIWAFFHAAGGAFYAEGDVWYALMLIHIVGQPFNILRYDQAIHMFGFFVTTLLMFHLVEANLKKKFSLIPVLIVTFAAGMGFGALNEVVEFIVSILIKSNGVGGYFNTGMDLISNLIGALVGVIFIKYKDLKKK